MSSQGENTSVQTDPQYSVPPATAPGGGDGLWGVIWHRRRVVVLTILVALEVGVLYIILAPPIYTSTSRLYVEPAVPRVIGDPTRSASRSKNYLETQCELIRSTPILRAALDSCGGDEMQIVRDQGDPVAYLKEALEVKAGKKDDIISVSLDSPYHTEANLLVNSIVDAYVGCHPRNERSTAGAVLKILREEKRRRSKELAGSFQALMDFKQANGIVTLEDGNVMVRRLEELSEALTTAELETIVAKADCEAAKAMIDDPSKMRYFVEQNAKSGTTESSKEMAQLSAGIAELQLQMAVLRKECREDHPAVQALQAKMMQMEQRQVEADREFVRNHLAMTRQKLEAAEQKQREIKASFTQQQKLTGQLDAKFARYALLDADFKRNLKISELLEQRISEITLGGEVGPVFVQVLEEATYQDAPTSPNRAQVGIMSLGLGVMLGVMLGLIQNRLDDRIHSAAEVPAVLRLPLLGAVPTIMNEKTKLYRGQTVLLDPSSPAAEAYRDIRTAVYFGVRDMQVRTLLITSAQPGDGKTTLVSNLGIAMALTHQRTLIVDADLRNPLQHEIFHINCAPGLAGVVLDNVPLNQAIQQTCVDDLDLLPSGESPSSPAELLNSPTFIRALKELTSRYDRIVVDSSPLLSVTDARILGAICDATVLVMRAEKSTHQVVDQAVDELLDVGGRVLGGVINAVPRGSNRYGRYNHYGYRRKARPRKARQSKSPSDPVKV